MTVNVNEMLERNMQDVRWKEQAGKEFGKHGSTQPKVIIITCMSPWVDPADMFDLLPGEAYVIRNAGNLVTQDTMRCILLAMINDKITDIIVLGHLDCANADINVVSAKYRALVEKIPQASKYRELLGTKDKAMKYFMMFQNEIDNVISQVENVRFFKTIQPTINITGMLYNGENGLVYNFSEIKELRKLMEKEAPTLEKVSKIIPKRYKDYLKEQKSQATPKLSPATAVQKIGSTGRETKTKTSKLSTTVKSQTREKLPPLPAKSEITNEKPPAIEPAGMNEELQLKFDAAQKNFEIMQKTIQKSMARITNVRVFVPKVHAPVVRIPGRKTQKKQED